MAKKSNARRITRRDAITLIGVGAISGVPRTAAARYSPPPEHPQCNNPAIVSQYRKGTTEAIASFSCCEETKNAVLVGVAEPGRAATALGKKHLLPLQTRLDNSQLLEYCFMMWGLKEEEAKNLYQTVPKNLGFELVANPKVK